MSDYAGINSPPSSPQDPRSPAAHRRHPVSADLALDLVAAGKGGAQLRDGIHLRRELRELIA